MSAITGVSKSSVNRIVNGNHKYSNTNPFYIEEDGTLKAIETLKNTEGIYGSAKFDDKDKQYIAIMKKIGIKKEQINNIYRNISPSVIRQVWSKPVTIKIEEFNPIYIGMEQKEFNYIIELFKKF